MLLMLFIDFMVFILFMLFNVSFLELFFNRLSLYTGDASKAGYGRRSIISGSGPLRTESFAVLNESNR